MPKEDEPGTGFEVKQIYPPTGAQHQGQVQVPTNNNSGYVVVPNGPSPIVLVQPPAAQPVASQPSLVVLTVGNKDEKKEKKTEISSVFQRL